MLTGSQKIEAYKVLGQVAMYPGGSGFTIAWAMALVEQGVETENLIMLATLPEPANEFEADDIFNKVLAELFIIKPSDKTAIEGYVKVLSEEVVQGQLLPLLGVAMIQAEGGQ